MAETRIRAQPTGAGPRLEATDPADAKKRRGRPPGSVNPPVSPEVHKTGTSPPPPPRPPTAPGLPDPFAPPAMPDAPPNPPNDPATFSMILTGIYNVPAAVSMARRRPAPIVESLVVKPAELDAYAAALARRFDAHGIYLGGSGLAGDLTDYGIIAAAHFALAREHVPQYLAAVARVRAAEAAAEAGAPPSPRDTAGSPPAEPPAPGTPAQPRPTVVQGGRAGEPATPAGSGKFRFDGRDLDVLSRQPNRGAAQMMEETRPL